MYIYGIVLFQAALTYPQGTTNF